MESTLNNRQKNSILNALTMGFYTEFQLDEYNKDEAIESIEHMMALLNYNDELHGIDVYNQATKHTKGKKIAGISFTLLLGQFNCINIVFATSGNKQPKLTLKNGEPVASGVFSYVFNLDAPYLSELGYTYFQKQVTSQGDFYMRIV